ncbi:DUF4876 domain-containing protein [Fidelibacter multiformis]|uniref:DUF4876 domain-containing protein n=1 Tax=Fidelibacter multiformis TaxID=3377529 RepID=UPI0037DBF2E9
MKQYTLLLSILFLFTWACVDVPEAPNSAHFNLKIQLQDTTVFSTGSFNSTEGATVTLLSLTDGNKLTTVTDSLGTASFSAVLPDRYSISVSRPLKTEEIWEVLNRNEMWTLNGDSSNVILFAEPGETLTVTVPLSRSRSGSLVISEIYYSGSKPDPIPNYFHDQFLEIYNNSETTQYLDSLIICDTDYGFAEDSYLHAIHAYMFPGTGTDYPLEPGEAVVIAQDAINHAQYNKSSIDLTDADFEYYVKDQGDVNNTDAVDMIQIHHKYGIDFLYSVFNDAILLVKVKDPYKHGYDNFERLLIPVTSVIDGVDYRENTSLMDKKRLSAAIDAGLAGGMPAYTTQSVSRIVDTVAVDGRVILKDSNNSSFDFITSQELTPGEVPQ